MHKLTEKLREMKRFVHFVIQHFFQDDCPYRASALAFTSLLAMLPLMAIGFAILSAFPVFQNLSQPIQHFIFANFVPATGEIIQNYLQVLAGQASQLSTMGILFLFAVSILVLFTIEHAMNDIWRVHTSRHGLRAVLFYWGIVSLAPFFLALSIILSSYILSIPFIARHDVPSLINYLPFVFSLAAFTCLYVLVPNCPVQLLHAFYGGLVAALLFESAKWLFVFYLSHYDIYHLLYGPFATIPIFFIWVYWVWLITLLGAEVSYAYSVHHQRRQGISIDGFSHALLWLQELRQAQLSGKELRINELINASERAYAVDAHDMLKLFVDLQFVKMTHDGHYLLYRDLNLLSLYELSQLLPYPLPKAKTLTEHPELINEKWQKIMQKVNADLERALPLSVSELLDEAK
jgi:membrane protein